MSFTKYVKQLWDTKSFVNPTRMNHLENGIQSCSDGVEGLLSDFDGLTSDIDTIKTDLSAKANKATTLIGYGITDGATKTELSAKGTYSKPSGGIPKTDLASAVQTSLGKADTALQSYTEKYTGTITKVQANGTDIASSGTANIPSASTSKYGVTKLTSDLTGTSEVLAVTQKAVNELNSKFSHIGMIIHSTTLDTQEKVKAIYGGITWVKIEGMFLLGQSSSYTINSTGGESKVKLSLSETPKQPQTVHIDGLGTLVLDGSADTTGWNKSYSYGDNLKVRLLGNAVKGVTSNIALTTVGDNDVISHNNMPPYKVVYIWERTA